MRKYLLAGMLLLLTMGVRAQANSPTALTTMARYYTAEVMFWGVLRTDENFFQEVDRFAVHLAASLHLPPENISVNALLNQTVRQIMDEPFAESVRPWLGDAVAIGGTLEARTMMQNGRPSLYVAAALKDRAGCLEAIDAVIEGNNIASVFNIRQQGDFTLYEAKFPGRAVSLAVGRDILFLGLEARLFPLNGVPASLADSPNFTALLADLPQNNYSALLYLDTGQLQAFNAQVNSLMTNLPMFGLMQRLTQANSARLLWGLAITDSRTLLLDMVGRTDTALPGEMGMTLPVPGALDMSLLEHIPADAPFVFQSADFGTAVQAGFDNFRALSRFIRENGGFAALMGLPDDALDRQERAVLNLIDPGSLLAVFNITFAGLTGLSFERDVLIALDGDAAVYLRLRPSREEDAPFLPDVALVFQSSAPEKTGNLLQELIAASKAYDTGYPVERYGRNGSALVFPLASQITGRYLPALDWLVAADDQLFVMGTRAAVMNAVETPVSLSELPALQNAARLFLPGAQQLGFFYPAPLVRTIETVLRNANRSFEQLSPWQLQNFAAARQILTLIESVSLTSVMSANGQSAARLTLTLRDEQEHTP